jgi:hypothetical protein
VASTASAACRRGTSLKDTDKDGIADKYETNTGIFVSQEDTGTHPNNRDTDQDGMIRW